MGLKNRKRLIRLCEKYGLVGVESREISEVLIIYVGEHFPSRVGIVTFEELRCPDWEKLEELVVSLSLSTGAWSE